MADFEFDMSEVEALIKVLGKVPAQVEKRLSKSVRKAGLDMQRDAMLAAPVDTGNLMSSISMDTDSDGLGVTVGPTANYGHFVEYGTSQMGPQPYMGPAFDRNVPLFEKAARLAASDWFGGV